MLGRIFLGRYEAVRLLGEGGMGRVYLAHQIDLGRPVVVKVMHDHVASDPKFCERFQRETLGIISSLVHKGVNNGGQQ
jgi:serine/threonine-protein kinase